MARKLTWVLPYGTMATEDLLKQVFVSSMPNVRNKIKRKIAFFVAFQFLSVANLEIFVTRNGLERTRNFLTNPPSNMRQNEAEIFRIAEKVIPD